MHALWIFVATALAAGFPEVSDLTPKQRKAFDEVVAEEFCACGSALTLSGCYERRPDCALAGDLSQLILKGIRSDVSSDEMLAYLSQMIMGPYCAQQRNFNPAAAPFKGPANAPVVVLEFADFRCGHCKQAAPLLREAASKNPDVKIVYMPFPLQGNPVSTLAAEAALAAQAQGRFWEMHDQLYETQEQGFDPAQLRKLAQKVGLDLARFDADMAAHKYLPTVNSLRQQGLEAGIEGTPALFVNGRAYDLDPVLNTLDQRLAMERHRNGNCR